MPWTNQPQPRTNFHPVGVALSTHFDLSLAGDELRVAAHLALAAIDRVHGDGPQPPIPVRSAAIDDRGVYTPQASRTVPHGIRIQRGSPTAAFDLVHEVFHCLDHRVFGLGRDYATNYNAEAFQALRRIVENTKSFQRLQETLSKQRVRVWLASRNRYIFEDVNRPLLRYLMRPGEYLARAYAQYIAIRSGEVRLLEELSIIRDAEIEKHYPEQWSDEDFLPVASGFDGLLEGRSWLAKIS